MKLLSNPDPTVYFGLDALIASRSLPSWIAVAIKKDRPKVEIFVQRGYCILTSPGGERVALVNAGTSVGQAILEYRQKLE